MMSIKKSKDFTKKAIFTLLASVLVFTLAVLPVGVWAPTPAKAAVTTSSIMESPPGMMIGPRMVFPAMGINMAADAGETLLSVKVDVLIPSGSAFDPTTGLAPLLANDDLSGIALFKDNKNAGAFGYPDPPENFQDTYLPLASAPTWSQNGSTYEAVLTLASPDALPSDDSGANMGSDYFIMINTSNNPPPGATFEVQFPAGGVVLSTSTFPASAAPANPNVITVGQGGMMGSPLVISEIQTAGGGGSPDSDEFIELYNRMPDQVDLSTWSIQYKDGAGDNLSVSSPASKCNLSGNISGNGYFLIANADGYDGGKQANSTYTTGSFALSASGGTVFLSNSQTFITSPNDSSIQDRVAWGSGTLYGEGMPAPASAANGSIERKAFPDATTTSMTTGIDVSMGNSFDSGNNIDDFVVRTTADPQNSTDTESCEMSGTNPVVINEVYYSKTTSDNQWIELYNNAGGPEEVSGWKIKAAGVTYTIPASTSISPGGYLVIHWDVEGTNDMPNLYTGTAGMALQVVAKGIIVWISGRLKMGK
ncbi:lamin tail domain-containing protein [Chloroflexota bacterium]